MASPSLIRSTSILSRGKQSTYNPLEISLSDVVSRTKGYPVVISENRTSVISKTTQRKVCHLCLDVVYFVSSDDPSLIHCCFVLIHDLDGQYIDLVINPERFTGYAGDSAHNVWRAIYEENCFGLSEASMSTSAKTGTSSRSDRLEAFSGGGGFGFSKLSEGWGTEMVKGGSRSEEMCEEKKVYYRVISGEYA